MALGVTQQSPGVDRHIMTQGQLEAQLRVLMAGYAAERVALGNVSTGAENDLKQATQIASKMVAHYGMSQEIGPVHYDYSTDHPFLGQRGGSDGAASEITLHAIEDEARKLLSRALNEAERIVESHRAQFDTLVRSLLEQETLEHEQLDQVWGLPEELAAT
jgi:cell division protease FtsH